ncbi:DUF402 domain-containing protein [Spiroplasma endosymbiont of Polydrusus formosus]|uniref:DUF402 domain-containing protein n=1 Tax=Spiroplasma endosymbiont of Polydrusus formosus TaxID=3139326 RepID=UPI0035B513BA
MNQQFGFFNRKNWSNIICMFKDTGTGINYYCNVALPFIMDQYINYDLDIKFFAGGSYKILDLK